MEESAFANWSKWPATRSNTLLLLLLLIIIIITSYQYISSYISSHSPRWKNSNSNLDSIHHRLEQEVCKEGCTKYEVVRGLPRLLSLFLLLLLWWCCMYNVYQTRRGIILPMSDVWWCIRVYSLKSSILSHSILNWAATYLACNVRIFLIIFGPPSHIIIRTYRILNSHTHT
jgi:hypothetical protein